MTLEARYAENYDEICWNIYFAPIFKVLILQLADGYQQLR